MLTLNMLANPVLYFCVEGLVWENGAAVRKEQKFGLLGLTLLSSALYWEEKTKKTPRSCFAILTVRVYSSWNRTPKFCPEDPVCGE